MKPIEIKTLRTWTEKQDGYPDGTLRIYCGNIHCGNAIPTRGKIEGWHFENLMEVVSVPPRTDLSLDEIMTHIELSLKEFCKKVLK